MSHENEVYLPFVRPELMICPYDCQPCSRPLCYADGCEVVGEFPLTPCEPCGELHIVFIYPPACTDCHEKAAQHEQDIP